MKILLFIAGLFLSATCLPQFYATSFEEPTVFTIEYTDLGDPNTGHDLINNTDQPYVDFPETNGELGYNARYEPYDSPGEGLSDGDDVGVTDYAGEVGAYTNGTKGYRVSDVDGNYIIEFDVISSTSISPSVSVDYFITETGYEGDGTVNESGSDRLRIYVKDLSHMTEFDILDTTGSDINDLAIEGRWITGETLLTPYNGTAIDFQLVIEVRCNSSAEDFYFDNVIFGEQLGSNDALSNGFVMYPNPAMDGILNVQSDRNGWIDVEIYDITGTLICSSELRNSQLDISTLKSGAYLVKITQDEITQTKKLIVR